MKKKIFLIIAILIAIPAFPSFEKGNEFYIAEEYRKASEAYMEVVEFGFVSAELYFNLGNSFFRLGDYPSAILYYEKAKRLSPKDEEILMNLGIANTKITDKFEVMPDVFFVRWWKTFSGFFSRDQWAIIFLCIVVVSVLCLAWYFLASTYRGKRTAFYVCFLFVIFSGTAFGAAVQQHREQTRHAGIIMKNKVSVSSSPQIDRQKFVIHGGAKVDILDEIGGYYRIRVADGSNGWVSKEDLAVI
ncbi:MAG: tetratricopeptide repeat protein [Bacteroidales bacterium]|jgi:tetratricopeptide (TPR) repeat protein|nr:tetratricopeptide repeat protein [Bacteroidales bacterium]